MDDSLQQKFEEARSSDKQIQNDAFFYLIELTQEPVDWAYEIWDEMLADLSHKDNHRRAIAAQILCNLAKSDPDNRMQDDFPALLAVTKDERFVTARHCLQAIWKVGLAGQAQQAQVIDGLTSRFEDYIIEKNCTLIRFDIIQGLRNLYDLAQDEGIKQSALDLIETEEDLKYRKKYAKVWK